MVEAVKPTDFQDPVQYRVDVNHWQDGSIDISVHGCGSSEADRAAVVYALKEAIRQLEECEVIDVKNFS